MRKLIDRFIEILIKKINEINEDFICYYEEAPTTAKFPYLVMPTLNITPLDTGYLGVFDLEIYINELSIISLEQILDSLRDNLSNYYYCEDKLAFHLGFENQLLNKSLEQDLSIRKITFAARIFR